jgi:hypothetical protein
MSSSASPTRLPTRRGPPTMASRSVALLTIAATPEAVTAKPCHSRATSDGQARCRADNHGRSHANDELAVSHSSELERIPGHA